MQTALLHHQKAEQKRIRKRDHMRKKRAKQKPPGGSFAGPLSKVHLNSLDSPTLTQEEKVNRKKMQDRVNLQRRRLKQRLLSPSYSLCHHEDMNRVNSWFALHADDTEFILHLPPWELYSTKLASVYLHAREVLDKTGRNGPSRLPDELQDNPHDKKWVEIPPDVTEFLDFENDLLHVVRCGSPLLDRVASNWLLKDPIYRNGLLDVNFSIIVNALLSTQIGSGDIKRAPDSIRVSFGFNEYSCPTSFGNVDKLLGKSNAKAFKREVGRIAEFLCATMIFLQFASDNKPIWTSSEKRCRICSRDSKSSAPTPDFTNACRDGGGIPHAPNKITPIQ